MIKINLKEHNGYTSDRLIKLKLATSKIGQVLNSDEFKSRVLNAKFHFRKNWLGRWIDTFYTNQQVYNIIMSANEEGANVENYSMDLYLTLINKDGGNVVGFGNPGEKEIYTYATAFDKMSIAEIANHIVHEWTHKLGFTHAIYSLPWGHRDNSVPYLVGYIIEELVIEQNHINI